MREGRLGVAVNKNTGIEALMDAGVEHLFLSDDDTWPLSHEAVELHLSSGVSGNPSHTGLAHSMVCWGYHRLQWPSHGNWAEWTWPRGSMLYAHRSVIERVGGMIEEFGPGGHEHVEWSRRIHQAGLTPVLYPTPAVYAGNGQRTDASAGGAGMGAGDYWYAEDMPRPNEGRAKFSLRKLRTTSVRRLHTDWPKIEALMARRDHDTSFVPYAAGGNGRASATLYHSRRA